MLEKFLEILFSIQYPLIGLVVIFAILSFYWNAIFNFLKLKTYDNVQRVHANEVSRLGGLVIYAFFWIIFFFDFIEDKLFFNILISSIPFVLISLKEDLLQNTAPRNRLLLMILSCLIFFYINPITFPIIDIPYIGDLISFYPISILFFSFSILVLMNGMNLIDGMNGLMPLTVFFQLLSLMIISLTVNDLFVFQLTIIFALPLIFFLLFNFPLGKLFIGDLGAYFYGYVIGLLIIYFFGKYNNLLTWNAIVILFYPCFELLFSFIRKIRNNINAFEADASHLHSIICNYLVKFKLINNNKANNLVTIFLIPFYVLPFFISINFYSTSYIFLSLAILILIYLYFYSLFKS